MTYSRRVAITTGVSILAHGVLLWVGQNRVEAKPLMLSERPPIVFRLEPLPQPEPDPEPEPERVRTINDTPDPTNEPVEDTDLISDNNSKARDESDQTGDRVAPASDQPDDFDAVEQIPTAEPMPLVEPPSPPVETEQEDSSDTDTQESSTAIELIAEEAAEAAQETSPMDETESAEEAPAETAESAPQEKIDKPAEKAPPEPLKIAKAIIPETEPPPLRIDQDLRAGRTRDNGGTSERGVINFEAKSHELGEFMLQVRKQVELQWHTAIQLRYSGVRRVEAIIECSIRPDGMIESVTIVDPGDSMTFAILCRESIRKAAPFPPLGFKVPEIYRSRNIEIRWRFSYMN